VHDDAKQPFGESLFGKMKLRDRPALTAMNKIKAGLHFARRSALQPAAQQQGYG
tara:strand:+ start:3801 stop:3962 length:162 start_codon:yes stop_codon:yes gene_type:complete